MNVRLLLFLIALLFASKVKAQKIEWTWVAGDSTVGERAHYGTKGVADANNHPGSRSSGLHWTDDEGNFWMWGGIIEDRGSKAFKWASDLWKWDGQFWTWMQGDSADFEQKASFGTKGITAKENTPGILFHASCTYYNGKLYVFGGTGYDVNGKYGMLNNVWTWDGINWTWISGTGISNRPAVFGTKGEPGSGATPGARTRAKIVFDKNGTLWMYGGYGYVNTVLGHLDDLWKWDEQGWTFMEGSKTLNALPSHVAKGKAGVGNLPGARYGAIVWIDTLGRFTLFSGSTLGSSGNEVFIWEEKSWVWAYGDPDSFKTRHNKLYALDTVNTIGGRAHSGHWQDDNGDVWLWGGYGADSSSTLVNFADLWKWNGMFWSWMGGSTTSDEPGFFGTKGKASAQNIPPARSSPYVWQDKLGNKWLYSRDNNSYPKRQYRPDVWKLQIELLPKIKISGNNLTIESGDLNPTTVDNTDFGSVSISNIPLRKTYVIENTGFSELKLAWNPQLALRNTNGGFKIVRQPQKSSLGRGDTTHFVIEFDPEEEKYYEAQVFTESNVEGKEIYSFKIEGRGLEPRVAVIDSPTCNSINLQIDSLGADHYLVMVTDSNTAFAFPTNGTYYNYSPQYLKAPRLNGLARIVYQGAERNITVKGLISGRSYAVIIVPGYGSTESPTYQQDSSNILYFRTPGSVWQDSLSIWPKQDSTICYGDTLELLGKSPFPINWMDGLEEKERQLLKAGEYYFLSIDQDDCILSSDSTNHKIVRPQVDSITSTAEPYCKGDSVLLTGYGSHSPSWRLQENTDKLWVTQNGTYVFSTTFRSDCWAQDSILIEFADSVNLRFLQDTFRSIGPTIGLEYETIASRQQWTLLQSQGTNLDFLEVTDSGYLILTVSNDAGCSTSDSTFIAFRPLVLEAFPNAFSPNGDGLNDLWWFNSQLDSGTLIIHDRWGEVIHSGAPVWDGQKNGATLPIGAYIYQFHPLSKDQEPVFGVIYIVK